MILNTKYLKVVTQNFIVFLLLISALGCSQNEQEVYMFSYFQNNGADGLHLAYSEDGLNWRALNDNQALLKPEVGEAKLMRDPCIIKGGDGKFHMVWTAGWNEKGIGYTNSTDLMNWSEQQFIPVMEHETTARNTWAPELYYDNELGFYLIYWASTIPGKFLETDSTGDDGYNHRMYYTTTKDFTDFSDTKILYDDGFNVIDATIHKIDDEYVMFLKDETRYPEAEKNIRIAKSAQLLGPYSSASEPITGNWVEGPTAIKIDEDWIVFFDRYINHEMGAVRSKNLEDWTDISDQLTFPEGTRHGTVFKVKQSVLENIKTAINQ